MSNIIKFPRPALNAAAARPAAPAKTHATQTVDAKAKSSVSVMGWVQGVVALLWLILKWSVAIDVTWQFFRMLYYWHTPGVYAGWTFLLHFGVQVGLTYFVGVYRPKGGIF